MKRYSAVWWISVVLKLLAIYIVVGAAVNALFVPAINNLNPTRAFYVIGVPFYVSADISRTLQVVWQLLRSLAEASVLLAVSEMLRMVANTEAYARGTYSLSRRRGGGGEAPADSTSAPVKRRPTSDPLPPVFDERPTASADLRYSPTAGYRQQRLPMSPVRRVTVLKQRRGHEVHPPRPVGQVEVIDSLDGTHEARSSLPFDRI